MPPMLKNIDGFLPILEVDVVEVQDNEESGQFSAVVKCPTCGSVKEHELGPPCNRNSATACSQTNQAVILITSHGGEETAAQWGTRSAGRRAPS